jgi:hypothetical protein
MMARHATDGLELAMAVDEDRQVDQGAHTPGIREDEPAENKTDLEAQTRRLVAVLVSATFSVIALIVVIGGMIGRFDQVLVDAVVTALASAAGAVWVYLFQRKSGGQ